jgi:hypothetical protein
MTRRFLSTGEPHDTAPRVYGAGRFDVGTTPAEEWACFGSHYFMLPLLEVVEGVRCATVACVVAWDGAAEAAGTSKYCSPRHNMPCMKLKERAIKGRWVTRRVTSAWP